MSEATLNLKGARNCCWWKYTGNQIALRTATELLANYILALTLHTIHSSIVTITKGVTILPRRFWHIC